MRDLVIQEITEAARRDRNIVFLSADFGAPALDEFRRDLPEQFIHTGIAEQHMIDMAAGLALAGKKVFCYAMAPFITARCFEQVKCSLSAMNLPVTLIGVGVGLGYDNTSMTHICIDDVALMRVIRGLEILTPADDNSAVACARLCLEEPALRFLRLDRYSQAPLYSDIDSARAALDHGMALHGSPAEDDGQPNVLVVASGAMVHVCQNALRDRFPKDRVGVVEVIRVKPFDPVRFAAYPRAGTRLVFVEEQLEDGGMASAILEGLMRSSPEKLLRWPMSRIAIRSDFTLIHAAREELRVHMHIAEADIAGAVEQHLAS